MMPVVPMPNGFLAAGVNCGVRRYRPDLGLIRSELPCAAAGVFTRNAFKAAPVLYDMAILPSDDVRAILVNSGHANAATGELGLRDNQEFVDQAAKVLSLKSRQILVASTGVVGERLPLLKLIPALPTAARGFGDTVNNFALSIMTTDLVPKYCSEVVELKGGTVRLTACAKGSGMIHPNMATMLAFVTTDAAIDSDRLQTLLREITDETFNMISVDGETSTNDMVLALANGASRVPVNDSQDLQAFRLGLLKVCRDLAISVARDGEGATKLITVDVTGAPTIELARECARVVTTSPLIKSAIHGEDPNWGRIVVRLGQTGIEPELFTQIRITLQGIVVFADGLPQAFDRAQARQALQGDQAHIEIALGGGPFAATAWGCDLTKRYVEINTEYS